MSSTVPTTPAQRAADTALRAAVWAWMRANDKAPADTLFVEFVVLARVDYLDDEDSEPAELATILFPGGVISWTSTSSLIFGMAAAYARCYDDAHGEGAAEARFGSVTS